jgi:hypothetical protein
MKETTLQDPDLANLESIRDRLAEFRAQVKRLKDRAPLVPMVDEAQVKQKQRDQPRGRHPAKPE